MTSALLFGCLNAVIQTSNASQIVTGGRLASERVRDSIDRFLIQGIDSLYGIELQGCESTSVSSETAQLAKRLFGPQVPVKDEGWNNVPDTPGAGATNSAGNGGGASTQLVAISPSGRWLQAPDVVDRIDLSNCFQAPLGPVFELLRPPQGFVV
jgi:hypothetical protein